MGTISVSYDVNDGRGYITYITTNDATYSSFNKLLINYRTGRLGDGRNDILVDELEVIESKLN